MSKNEYKTALAYIEYMLKLAQTNPNKYRKILLDKTNLVLSNIVE